MFDKGFRGCDLVVQDSMSAKPLSNICDAGIVLGRLYVEMVYQKCFKQVESHEAVSAFNDLERKLLELDKSEFHRKPGCAYDMDRCAYVGAQLCFG